MDLDLKNKNALVGGSSKGIGKAAAIELSRLGANVTLLARNVKALTTALSELDHSQGQQHAYVVVDYTDIADLKKQLQKLVNTKIIHILVNNTGGPPGGAIIEATEADFTQAFNNHLVCNQVLTKLVLEGMKKSAYGRIINIVSTSVREPLQGLGVSNTIRAAVGNWAKTMANELGGHGITVNNVLPGFTQTERLAEIMHDRAKKWGKTEEEVLAMMKAQVPMERFADPLEVGAAVAFLASPAASYITGTNLTVDGGRTKSH